MSETTFLSETVGQVADVFYFIFSMTTILLRVREEHTVPKATQLEVAG